MPTNEHFPYKLKPALEGDNIADAIDVEVDSSSFTGLLAGMTLDDLQALANAIDALMVDGGTPGMVHANMVSLSQDSLTALLSGAENVQQALERIDATGLGVSATEISGSFSATYSEGSENTNTWYGGKQTVFIRVNPPTNGQYTFTMPDSGDMLALFDNLASKNIGEVYTLTIEYIGGNTGFVNRNRLTINNASISNGFPQGTFPTVLAQGQSATFRIIRTGTSISQWERLGIMQSVNPAPTFGEFVFQDAGWSNLDGSFLPRSSQVLKGYAFPVVGSSPNDGTLRQGLLDAGVSDRVIFDRDYVVWTADSFTSWSNGDDWFVLPRNQLENISREQGNFLAQITEIDSRIDLGFVSSMGAEALVWLSENPLVRAPFLNPSGDTGSAPDGNPRPGDDYEYIGGRENRNAMQQFTFGQNRFNNYLTVGISPNFIASHNLDDIRIRIVEVDTRNILAEYNLNTDFTFVDDDTFTNSTVRHYQRNVSVNYPFLATIEVVLTQVARHFRINPRSVDVTQNIPPNSIVESLLSETLRDKLNRPIPDTDARLQEIEPRLLQYRNKVTMEDDIHARFYDDDGTGAYPSDLNQFNQVSSQNPQYTASNSVLFIATPEPGNFALKNATANSVVALDNDEPAVESVESFTVNGVSYFVFRVTGITSGNLYEVQRITIQRVLGIPDDIATLIQEVDNINAELKHALLNLNENVVSVIENELAVTNGDNVSVVASDYNKSLGPQDTQKVFKEPNANSLSGGLLNSRPLNENAGNQVGKKIVYFGSANQFGNSIIMRAFDGTSDTDLIEFRNGTFYGKKFVDAIPAGSVTETIYPAPATKVTGPGIWIAVETLTFVNGIPVTEADEIFYTRNIPRQSETLNIRYRGKANGNLFGESTTTLAGVGGAVDAIANFTLNDGSEQAFVQVWWQASSRRIRVSVTERVNTGLPTIEDIEVILSYNETRVVPSVPAGTRDVSLGELQSNSAQVFAIKPSADNDVIIVSDTLELNTNYSYDDLFGNPNTGTISISASVGEFFNYEGFDVTASTVRDLESHSTLDQFGLFTILHTQTTITHLGTQLTVLDSSGNVRNVGDLLTQLLET